MSEREEFKPVDVAEAEALIAFHLPEYPAVVCPLSLAHGRILREDIVSDRDQPPFDRVTMDGIAIRFDSWKAGRTSFRIQGVQQAGQPEQALDSDDACFEVMTGAMLPRLCDCVIRIEDVSVEGDNAIVAPDAKVHAHQNVHRRASDCPAGAVVLKKGQALRAPQIAIAAAVGKSQVTLGHTPSVAVVSTGDELVDVGAAIEPHQIRRSNMYAIIAAFRRLHFPVIEGFHIPDDPMVTRTQLQEILRRFDVLLITGGVSMGKYDYVPGALTALKVSTVFHGVTQRPGKPMWFGVSERQQPVFALPGNPVSALVCLHRYVIPSLYRAMGLRMAAVEYATLEDEVVFKTPLTYFLPIRLKDGEGGRRVAEPMPTNTSGDFAGLAATDGFVELQKERDVFPSGHVAPLYRWM